MCCKVKHFPSASDAEPSASISALQSVESFMAIRLSHLGQKSGLKEEPSSVTLRLDSKYLRVNYSIPVVLFLDILRTSESAV